MLNYDQSFHCIVSCKSCSFTVLCVHQLFISFFTQKYFARKTTYASLTARVIYDPYVFGYQVCLFSIICYTNYIMYHSMVRYSNRSIKRSALQKSGIVKHHFIAFIVLTIHVLPIVVICGYKYPLLRLLLGAKDRLRPNCQGESWRRMR